MPINSISKLVQEFESAVSSGNYEEFERLRQEYFNSLAQEFKRKKDLLGLNLLAAADEAARSGLNSAAGHLEILLALYSGGKESLNLGCNRLYKGIDSDFANLLQRQRQIDSLEKA